MKNKMKFAASRRPPAANAAENATPRHLMIVKLASRTYGYGVDARNIVYPLITCYLFVKIKPVAKEKKSIFLMACCYCKKIEANFLLLHSMCFPHG